MDKTCRAIPLVTFLTSENPGGIQLFGFKAIFPPGFMKRLYVPQRLDDLSVSKLIFTCFANPHPVLVQGNSCNQK